MYFIYSLLLPSAFSSYCPAFFSMHFVMASMSPDFASAWGSLSPITRWPPGDLDSLCFRRRNSGSASPGPGTQEATSQSPIAISTMTLTGQNLAREIFKDDAAKFSTFPSTGAGSCAARLRPSTLNRFELWRRNFGRAFCGSARQQQIPVALVNGRLSARSFRRYRLIRGLCRAFSAP